MALTKITASAATLFILLSLPSFAAAALSPVIVVPGDGGSQVEAKLNKPSTINILCPRQTTNWYLLWLDAAAIVPTLFECLVDNMKLIFNPATNKTTNQPGVSTRIPQFGNTGSVEWLDGLKLVPYYNPLVDFLVKNYGYVRGVSIRGAPYDFRKGPDEMASFVASYKQLINDTYVKNGNRPVVLIAHSMGNLHTRYLLQSQTLQWRKKYIKAFIAIAAPWGGAVKPLRLLVSGDNLDVVVWDNKVARTLERSWPSTAYLMAYNTFWNGKEPLIYAPDATYTVNNYQRLFQDIGFPDGYRMRLNTQPYLQKLESPGVEVHCLHGIGVNTPASYKYSKPFFPWVKWYDQQPDIIFDDGDGAVNIRSLRGCLRWVNATATKVFHKQFNQADHGAILKNQDVFKYIVSVLSK